jgi:hypothetical protein
MLYGMYFSYLLSIYLTIYHMLFFNKTSVGPMLYGRYFSYLRNDNNSFLNEKDKTCPSVSGTTARNKSDFQSQQQRTKMLHCPFQAPGPRRAGAQENPPCFASEK